MKYDLRHLKALVPARTDGSLCPACFEVIALHTYLSVVAIQVWKFDHIVYPTNLCNVFLYMKIYKHKFVLN